jgi:cell division protein FtsI (penicillin-binding protein 3)
MKPFVIALALEKGLVKPDTLIQTAPGRMTIGVPPLPMPTPTVH